MVVTVVCQSAGAQQQECVPHLLSGVNKMCYTTCVSFCEQ